jgi:nitroimidazol reductase NimA-like FMN-containing flavoprotein (pyridoxamine 5'-phosphate oxidase superfamily)
MPNFMLPAKELARQRAAKQARGKAMKPELRKKIFEILDDNRLMTVATKRPDGWPQATTVGFANDGLDLLFLCGPDSQKAKNLARDDRVSATIDHDVKDPMKIAGLSLAGHARPVTGMKEVERFYEMLGRKYPEYAAFPKPDLSQVKVFRVRPTVISVLDYTKGFAHTDLVEVKAADLAA